VWRACASLFRKRLRYDSTLYLEMSLCNEWGMPHSEFLEWEPDDRSKALAFAIEKGQKCGLCGTADWEWEEDKRAYTPIEHFCLGCYYKGQLEEDSGSQKGTTVQLVPTSSSAHQKRLVMQAKQYAKRGKDK
jgi:hypothetical protein